jgi:hypothetical protein
MRRTNKKHIVKTRKYNSKIHKNTIKKRHKRTVKKNNRKKDKKLRGGYNHDVSGLEIELRPWADLPEFLNDNITSFYELKCYKTDSKISEDEYNEYKSMIESLLSKNELTDEEHTHLSEEHKELYKKREYYNGMHNQALTKYYYRIIRIVDKDELLELHNGIHNQALSNYYPIIPIEYKDELLEDCIKKLRSEDGLFRNPMYSDMLDIVSLLKTKSVITLDPLYRALDRCDLDEISEHSKALIDIIKYSTGVDTDIVEQILIYIKKYSPSIKSYYLTIGEDKSATAAATTQEDQSDTAAATTQEDKWGMMFEQILESVIIRLDFCIKQNKKAVLHHEVASVKPVVFIEESNKEKMLTCKGQFKEGHGFQGKIFSDKSLGDMLDIVILLRESRLLDKSFDAGYNVLHTTFLDTLFKTVKDHKSGAIDDAVFITSLEKQISEERKKERLEESLEESLKKEIIDNVLNYIKTHKDLSFESILQNVNTRLTECLKTLSTSPSI